LLPDAKIKAQQIELKNRISKSPEVKSHGVTNPSITSKLRHEPHKQLSNICARTSGVATLVYDIMDTKLKLTSLLLQLDGEFSLHVSTGLFA
jgi:hypothetical protein